MEISGGASSLGNRVRVSDVDKLNVQFTSLITTKVDPYLTQGMAPLCQLKPALDLDKAVSRFFF